MFKKLLSNLPFNPSLVEQVAFYAKRLHREAFLRTVGAVLLVLALVLQIFAVVSPPQTTLAANGNDLIPGGFASQAEAVAHCNSNDYGYRDILAPYAIGCAQIANGSISTIHSRDYGGQLYSMGRIAYGKAGEYAVPNNLTGQTYYMRYLWSWDSGVQSSYKVITGTGLNGQRFFLLFGCGNLVIIGKPTPPPPPPPPPVDQCPNILGFQTSQSECDVCPNIPGTQSSGSCLPCPKSANFNDIASCRIRKKTARNITQSITNANNTTAKPGDTIEYTLSVQNTSVLDDKNFVVQENVEDILEYATISDLHGGKLANNVVSWPAKTIKAKSTISQKLTIKVKNPLPNTPRSTSNPGSFDLVMTNTYGNTINIKLPNTPVKTTELVTTELPNTGPGSSLLVGFVLASVVGYFIARTRLMAKELDIAKHETVSIGGQ